MGALKKSSVHSFTLQFLPVPNNFISAFGMRTNLLTGSHIEHVKPSHANYIFLPDISCYKYKSCTSYWPGITFVLCVCAFNLCHFVQLSSNICGWTKNCK